MAFRKKQTCKRSIRGQREEAACTSVFPETLLSHSVVSGKGHPIL